MALIFIWQCPLISVEVIIDIYEAKRDNYNSFYNSGCVYPSNKGYCLETDKHKKNCERKKERKKERKTKLLKKEKKSVLCVYFRVNYFCW